MSKERHIGKMHRKTKTRTFAPSDEGGKEPTYS